SSSILRSYSSSEVTYASLLLGVLQKLQKRQCEKQILVILTFLSIIQPTLLPGFSLCLTRSPMYISSSSGASSQRVNASSPVMRPPMATLSYNCSLTPILSIPAHYGSSV